MASKYHEPFISAKSGDPTEKCGSHRTAVPNRDPTEQPSDPTEKPQPISAKSGSGKYGKVAPMNSVATAWADPTVTGSQDLATDTVDTFTRACVTENVRLAAAGLRRRYGHHDTR